VSADRGGDRARECEAQPQSSRGVNHRREGERAMGQELNPRPGAFQDKTLTCFDCHKPFTYTARDQEFFAGKGWTPPKRCKPCRELAKVARGKNDRV
jgi:hypothetical protein